MNALEKAVAHMFFTGNPAHPLDSVSMLLGLGVGALLMILAFALFGLVGAWRKNQH